MSMILLSHNFIYVVLVDEIGITIITTPHYDIIICINAIILRWFVSQHYSMLRTNHWEENFLSIQLDNLDSFLSMQ